MKANHLKKYKIKEEKVQNRTGPRIGRKEMLIALGVCAAIAVLYFALPPLIRALTAEEEPEKRGYRFSPILVDENIFADKSYMDLDRNFYFENPTESITTSFDTETLSEIPDEYRLPVSCLVSYVQAAIDGDDEAMGDLYSAKYEKNGFPVKQGFTAQKIYETKFTLISGGSVAENGEVWNQWSFWVEYKIHKNNGTFRDDMGSDCTRKEYFVVTYRDARMEIDGITPYNTEEYRRS